MTKTKPTIKRGIVADIQSGFKDAISNGEIQRLISNVLNGDFVNE